MLWKKLKKFAVASFVFVNVSMIVLGSLPDRSTLCRKFMNLLQPYQNLFGLSQAWNMFSPNPSSKNSYVEAEIIFTDNSVEHWTLPRPTQMDWKEKFLGGERFRKFTQEHLLSRKRNGLLRDLGRFAAGDIEAIESQGRHREISEIKFFEYWSLVPKPEKQFIPHGQLTQNYTKSALYTYRPQAEGASDGTKKYSLRN
jgi:hypothetical protein